VGERAAGSMAMPGTIVWITARARAGATSTLEQEEGEAGSKAYGSGDTRGGRGAAR